MIRDRMVSGESEGLQERTGQQGVRVEEGRTKPVLILLGSRPLLGEARRPSLKQTHRQLSSLPI